MLKPRRFAKKMVKLLERMSEQLRDGKSTLKGYCKEAGSSRTVVDSQMESQSRRKVRSIAVLQWRRWKQLSVN